MELGERIRVLRKEHGLSLEELAGRSKVALATLSRLENGKGSGTFRTHQKIADALGLAITELYRGFEPPAAEEEAVMILPPTQPEDAETFTYDDKALAILLTNKSTGKRMLPQMVILQPGAKTTIEQYHRGTERWVFGLEGEMEIQVGGKSYRIERGGTLYFKASLPHRFFNRTKLVTKCITVSSPAVL